jgi:hypothetical protein
MKKLVIRNKSNAELSVMLEPWTPREDVEPGGTIEIIGDFSDEELIVDIGDDNFVSVWSPPASAIKIAS